MALRELGVNEVEAKMFSDLLSAQARAERDTKVAFALLIARHGLKEANFVSLDGGIVTIEVPE